jgi:hypothetical protein
MNKYIEELEKQNVELQERLAEAEPWVPHWTCDDYGDLVYANAYMTYGRVRQDWGIIIVCYGTTRNEIVKCSLDEAKKMIEDYTKQGKIP